VGTRYDRVIGGAAIAALCAAVAGANLPNPLLPEYVERFGLAPLAQSALFSTYLVALVAALAYSIVASGRGTPRATLLVALAAMIAADTALVVGSEQVAVLFAGRALSGVGVGLATGAAASIALSRLGERARTMVATSAVVGSLGGNLVGGAVGAFLPAPLVLGYALHIGAVLLIATPLLLHRRGSAAGRVDGAVLARPSTTVYRTRHRAAGYLVGAIAWSTAGVVLALVPAEVRRLSESASLFEAVLPSGVFLASAWAGQLILRGRITRVRAWHVVVLMVGGLGLIAWALRGGETELLLVGAAVAGLGQGPAYSVGLATVAAGLGPREQGRIASIFAGVAYAYCAVVVLLAGAAATLTSVPQAIGWVAASATVVACVSVLLAGRPQEGPRVAPAAVAVAE
jgi:MFS family permease